MTKTKSQLRAEAVERLRKVTYLNPFNMLAAILDRDSHIGCEDGRKDLIDLLTDECGPCYCCSKLAELRAENNALREIVGDIEAPTDAGEASIASVEAFIEKQTEHESRDSREKLEDDVRQEIQAASFGFANINTANTIFGWLDRQAAITERGMRACLIRHNDKIAELQATRYDLETRNRKLQAKVDELTDENAELRAQIVEMQAECGVCDICIEYQDEIDEAKESREAAWGAYNRYNQEAVGQHREIAAERDYWKDQVRKCLHSACMHNGHAVYSEGIMDYPRGDGYCEPSLLVTSEIDHLKDFYADECRKSKRLEGELKTQRNNFDQATGARDYWKDKLSILLQRLRDMGCEVGGINDVPIDVKLPEVGE